MEKMPRSLINYSESPKQPNGDQEKDISKFNRKAVTLLLAGTIFASSILMGGCGEKAAAKQKPDLSANNETTYKISDIYKNGTDFPDDWSIDNNINYYNAPTSTVEGYTFDKLTSEQQSEIKKYEAMSTEEFFAIPQDEQLKYAYWIFENNKPKIDLMYKFNDDTRHYNFEPKTADDLFQNLIYEKGVFLSLTKEVSDGNGGTKVAYDKENASKLVSMSYLDDELNDSKVLDAVDKAGRPFDLIMSGHAMGYSKNNDGSVYVNAFEQMKDNDGENVQYHFIPKEFIDIHGDKQTIYLVSSGCSFDNVAFYNSDAENHTDISTEILP